MKLIYNLEYKRIHNDIFKNYKKHKRLEDVSKFWKPCLINNLNSMKRIIVGQSYFNFYKTLLLHQPFVKIKKFKDNFLIYIMNKNSGINWHEDDHVEYGVTYYLNKRWNRNWGGEFMFTHNGQNGYIPVTGNSLVIIKTPLLHKVNPVLINHLPRITIQVFI
jgi:Rps23 Pro-64 3,4-dihydroxylase Tpa1-like proline 4-hydroxylase